MRRNEIIEEVEKRPVEGRSPGVSLREDTVVVQVARP